MNIKKELYEKCCEFVEKKLNHIQKSILEIQECLTTETKSSAGDKHETGRAMLQLEREKVGQQLAEIQKLKETLSKIEVSKPQKAIALGSLVYTTKASYFIAISAGEFKIEDEIYYAISASTPIAQLLLGKTTKDNIVFQK
ncbi:3-oxoacyl-ACP synthase [Lacinutrix iliipiscaria]|uniref:3-oxoacyl-ACP synthase n=1 Tax=Lacinutrix iliipiscaria TaxID=1230532 RepID=A0ABW5WN38_9FLAO